MTNKLNQFGFAPLSLVLTLLIVIIVAIGAFYAGRFSNQPVSSTPSPSATSVVTQPTDSYFIDNSAQVPLAADQKTFSTYLYTASNGQFEDIGSISNLGTSNSFGDARPIAGPDKMVFYTDSANIFRYDLEKKISQKIYSVSKPTNDITNLFYQSPDNLYITETPKDYYGSTDSALIIEKNIKSGEQRVISGVKHVLYGSLSYIFTASNGADIIGSFGGDGCGGSGEITKVVNNQPSLIMETGGGCNTKPTYVGSIPKSDSVVLLSTYGEWNPTAEDSLKSDKLYSKNVLTGAEVVLIDLKKESTLSSVVPDLINQKVALIYKDQSFVIYDLATNQKSNVQSLKDIKTLHYVVEDYALTDSYDYQTKEFWLTALNSGQSTKYSYTNLPTTVAPGLIGSFEGNPLLFANKTSN